MYDPKQMVFRCVNDLIASRKPKHHSTISLFSFARSKHSVEREKLTAKFAVIAKLIFRRQKMFTFN